MFTGNNGSAVLLRSSVLVASGTLSFTHNKAMNGAAMKILDMSRVSYFVLKDLQSDSIVICEHTISSHFLNFQLILTLTLSFFVPVLPSP